MRGGAESACADLTLKEGRKGETEGKKERERERESESESESESERERTEYYSKSQQQMPAREISSSCTTFTTALYTN